MFHKRSIKEKLLKGSAWAFAGKLVSVLTALGVNALLARLLTPNEMGAYFLTLSLVSVAAVVAQLGLTQTLIKLVSESMAVEKLSRVRRSIVLALRMAAVSSLVVAVFFIFGGGAWIAENLFNLDVMLGVMGLISMWMAVLVYQGLISEVFRGFHDIRLATIFGGLVTSIISMVLFSSLWWLQGSSDYQQIVFLTLVAGGTSTAISSFILLDKLKKLPLLSFEEINTQKIISISWPLWVTSLTLIVLLQADLWILGMFSTKDEVAIYGAVARLVVLITMPLLIINAVVPPLIAEMSALGKIKELERLLRSIATWASFPAIFVVCIFAFYGDDVLSILYGEFYQSGGVVLMILGGGQLINVWAGSCGQVLMLTGHQSSMMKITIASGFLTVTLAYFLVAKFGAVGVACSAAAGMVVQNIIMLIIVKKKIGLWTHVNLCFSIK